MLFYGIMFSSFVFKLIGMYSKLSNRANSEKITRWCNLPFHYPKLHRPSVVFDGNDEVTLPIITMEDDAHISLGLWGILPDGYDDEWEFFQRVTYTLNAEIGNIQKQSWLSEALEHRRCLIVVTGYFTTFVKNSEVYHHFVSKIDEKPFLLAGVYNRTKDGYITFTIIVSAAREFIRKIHNVNGLMPLSLDKNLKETWLDSETTLLEIVDMIQRPSPNDLKSHSISKTLFNNDISYESMLEPFHYEDVPFESFDIEKN